MLKSALVALLKQRLGDRTDVGIDDKIGYELDAAQFQLENGEFVPWFLLSDELTLATVSSARTIAKPSNMLMEYDDGELEYVKADGSRIPLPKKRKEDLALAFQQTAGKPQAYAAVGNSYMIYPLPDAIYNLAHQYFKADTLPSLVADSAENLWMKYAGDWLMAKAGGELARFIKDIELAALFAQDELAAHKRVYYKHIQWEEENTSRVMES